MTMPLDPLARELARRIPLPFDALELAAVAESMGITDAVAASRYGVDDSFALGEALLPLVQARAVVRGATARERPVRQREGAVATALAQIAPIVVLGIALAALPGLGWSAQSLLALGVGVSGGVTVAAGPLLAAGVRAGGTLGLGRPAAARRGLALAALGTAAACAVAAGVGFATLARLDVLAPHDRAVFALALAGFGAIWPAAAALTYLGRPRRTLACLLAAVPAGVGTGTATGSGELALGAGAAAAAVATLVAWRAGAVRDPRRTPLRPPRRRVRETIPYGLVGTGTLLLILEPHLLAWTGRGAGRMHAVTAFELSLGLALAPYLAGALLLEPLLRSFWALADERRLEDRPTAFAAALRCGFRQRLLAHAALVAAVAAATAAGVVEAQEAGALEGVSRLVLFGGLAGFSLVAVGQLAVMTMVGLAVPARASLPLASGLGVLTAAGVPLARADHRNAALALALGAAAFAVPAVVRARRALRDADYHRATAF